MILYVFDYLPRQQGFNDSAIRAVEMAQTFLPAVAITVINFVVPFIFDYLVTLEHYKLEREVQVGMDTVLMSK